MDIWVRLILLAILVQPSAEAVAGDLPQWLVRAARSVDNCNPTLLITSVVGRGPDGESTEISWGRYETDGTVSLYESEIRFGVVNGVMQPVTGYGAKECWSSDGLVVHVVNGWLPGDNVETPLRPRTDEFKQIKGGIGPTDPARELSQELMTVAVRPSAMVRFRELLRDSTLVVTGYADQEPLPTSFTPHETPDRVVTIKDSVYEDFVGVEFYFASTSDWPLAAVRYPNGNVISHLRTSVSDGVSFVSEAIVGRPSSSNRVVVREVAFAPRSAGSVEMIEFLPGMEVSDSSLGYDKSIIWGDGEPARVLTHEEATFYGYTKAAPTPVPDSAISGRAAGRGWLFWSLNGALAVTVAILLVLRKRVS